MKQRDTVTHIISYLDQVYSIFDSNTPSLLIILILKVPLPFCSTPFTTSQIS